MSKVTSSLFCFAIVCVLATTAAFANGDQTDEPPPPPPPPPPPVETVPDTVTASSGGGDGGLLLFVLLGAVVLGVGARAQGQPIELGAPVILDDDLESGAGTGKY